MGSDLPPDVPPGAAPASVCDGTDVINALNTVFGDITSTGYNAAKTNKLFVDVIDIAHLIAAYQATDPSLAALLKPGSGWLKYLKTDLDDVEATQIATARATALEANIPMVTTKHASQTPIPGRVHVGAGTTNGQMTIDSPYPFP